MAMAQKVQMPARKPASAPQAAVVFASARNMARLTAISSEKNAVKPNVLAILPDLMSSSVSLLSVIQALPKTGRAYQMPPTTKDDRPAATTASQLINEKFMLKGLNQFVKINI